jgi:hypothetical protein
MKDSMISLNFLTQIKILKVVEFMGFAVEMIKIKIWLQQQEWDSLAVDVKTN